MKKNLKVISIITFNVLLVSLIRQAPYKSAPFKLFMHVLTMVLILVMIFAWAIHIQQYIVQIQLRRYMGFISMLMMLWMFLRFTRFYLFDEQLFISRHLWYLYYIPMIYIPLNSFLFSLYFGRSITWSAPKHYKILNLISLFFLMLVLFNDKLQAIFIFEDINDFNNYQYGPMYYLMIIYLIVLIFSMLINLVHKSFNHRKNNLVAIPFIVLAFGLMYVYIYIFMPQFVFLKYFDLTFMMVYINIIFLESVIMSGIITVNTDC
ncbi:MAG TPA: hypothetical protein VFC75_00455 [Erysipelothrix sp.]|nr:hypothetical protein [Erysipelothrix sp.]